jgi:uncharacterized protein YceK
MVNIFLVIYVATMVEACSAVIESNSQGTAAHIGSNACYKRNMHESYIDLGVSARI